MFSLVIEIYPWFSLFANLLALFFVPSVFTHKKGRPQAIVSWLLCLLFLPLLGVILWLIFGRDHLKRKIRRKRQSTAETERKLQQLAQAQYQATDGRSYPHLLDESKPIVLEDQKDNRVWPLLSSNDFFKVLLLHIRQAQQSIHLLYYTWNDDQIGVQILNALVDKANEGIEVRLLLDGFGSLRLTKHFFRPLLKAGGQIEWFLPPRIFVRYFRLNFRNHRKLAIIDGQYCFVGGINIAEEYLHWRDCACLIRGPLVDQAQEVFIDDWFFASDENLDHSRYFGSWQTAAQESQTYNLVPPEWADCSLIASGPDKTQSRLFDTIVLAIHETQSTIDICTPYFVPNQVLLATLRIAVLKGIRVRIYLPTNIDSRIVRMASLSYYEDLLELGVELFELDGPMVHAKLMLFDHDLTIVGSTNFDVRSFKLNFELSCIIKSTTINEQFSCFINQLHSQARPVDRNWLPQNRWQQIQQSFAQLVSPLL